MNTNALLVPRCGRRFAIGFILLFLSAGLLCSAAVRENVLLTDVPDYTWFAGCFGTASGNLMGYWDRHGFPDFYTGPTAGGIAPLDSDGENIGIRSLWASRAGFDGRPADKFGHIDDYWEYYLSDDSDSYESTDPDPFRTAGRAEHAADCIGDFIGLSQNKWTNLNGECDGNIDAFSFVFWDAQGDKRNDYIPTASNGQPIPDIPSGLKAWTRYRGYDSTVFSQLTDFNTSVAPGHGFSFENLKAEIDAGYPVLLYLQSFTDLYRSLPGMPRANPRMHGMLAYGYSVSEADDGSQTLSVRYKTSWGGSGLNTFSTWNGQFWQALLPVRGVIGYHPIPRIRKIIPSNQGLRFEWDGPSSVLSNLVSKTSAPVHWYVLERATHLNPPDFEAVGDATSDRSVTIPRSTDGKPAYFRVKIVSGPDGGGPPP